MSYTKLPNILKEIEKGQMSLQGAGERVDDVFKQRPNTAAYSLYSVRIKTACQPVSPS